MKRPIGNTVHLDDYQEIMEGVSAVKKAADFLRQRGVRTDLPHEHRLWEYGTGVQILLDHYKEKLPEIDVIDVGSGYSAFGPALAFFYNTQVVECEPDPICRDARMTCNVVLKQLGKKEIITTADDAMHLPDRKFDAVMCISVIEHVAVHEEMQVWEELGKRVKDGGILYVTVDCVPRKDGRYAYDNLRTQNFTLDDLKPRVAKLEEMGFATLGKPNWMYNGDAVFDYTFFRIGLVKNGASGTTFDMGGTVRDSGVRQESGDKPADAPVRSRWKR